ncbi:MAG: hypothetical protein IPP63_08295 [Chloracidobacterium sp.]|nr:hypothetical protein [Chloracidobacterium sp.]
MQTPIPQLDYSFKNTVPSKNANLVGVGGFSAPLRNERRSPRNIVPNSVFKNTAFTGQVSVGICVLITFDGSQYSCGSSTEGNPYSDNFADGARDPKTQILLGVADGGYANDNRKVATEISSVNSNLRRRVEDLKVRAAGVKNAVSEWNNKMENFFRRLMMRAIRT